MRDLAIHSKLRCARVEMTALDSHVIKTLYLDDYKTTYNSSFEICDVETCYILHTYTYICAKSTGALGEIYIYFFSCIHSLCKTLQLYTIVTHYTSLASPISAI